MTVDQNSMIHPETLAYENDYKITPQSLETTVQFASIPSLVILSITSISLTTLLIFLILDTYEFTLTVPETIIISFITTLVVYGLGALGGFAWQKIGLWVASNTYKIYTNKFTLPFFKYLGSIYLKIAGQDSVIYLEGQALDVNYRDFWSRFKFVFAIGISQLSFFLIYLSYLWNPIFENVSFLSSLISGYSLELQILLSLASSIGTMAIYLPATFILRDANLRLWNTKKRTIGQPLETIRSTIQSLIGISAILTGWEVYQNIADEDELLVLGYILPDIQFASIIYLLDYFMLLVIVIILTAPIIYPAAVTYNFRHSKNVNKFRTGAILSGVEVGVSKIRQAESDEKESIGEYINNYVF